MLRAAYPIACVFVFGVEIFAAKRHSVTAFGIDVKLVGNIFL